MQVDYHYFIFTAQCPIDERDSHDPIGPYYHSHSSPGIAKVAWHSWGEKDATILVLTSDGLLREYDVLRDPEEPTQVIDFCSDGSALPHSSSSSGMKSFTYGATPTKSSKRTTPGTALVKHRNSTPQKQKKKKPPLSAIDSDATTAVSLCFGEGQSDWSAFSLYCLMQNGDLYCVCPYLPKSARIPSLHLLHLAAFVSAKLTYLSDDFGDDMSSSEKSILESRYSHQLKFVNSLLSQQSTSTHPSSESDADNEAEEYDFISVRYLTYLRSAPVRQGPFLLQPSPRELPESDESLACDMSYIYLDRVEEGPGELGCILMAYSDGKVDLCLDVDKVEAQWEDTSVCVYSDFTDSVNKEQPELPSLLVYETIDLFGLSGSSSSSSLRIVKDPEYLDTLYVYHSHGAHSISLRPIFQSLVFPASSPSSSSAVVEREHLQKALRKQAQAHVAWLLRPSLGEDDVKDETPVIFLAAINDVYLGYALLVLTANSQLVAVELAFRTDRPVPQDEKPLQGLLQSSAASASGALVIAEKKSYVPFSDAMPFSLPALITTKSNAPSTRFTAPPSSSRSSHASQNGQIELTIDSLRFVGHTVEKLDASIRQLIQAGNTVQERLELHLRELPRQVDKLQNLDDSIKRKNELFSNDHGDRVERVKSNQKDLGTKADRILQRLIDNSQPDLSAFERRWMEELDRVKEAVEGQEGTSSTGLIRRMNRLKEQLELLKPQLEDSRPSVGQEGDGRMGESQRKRIEEALAIE